MPKTPIFPLLAALFEVLKKIPTRYEDSFSPAVNEPFQPITQPNATETASPDTTIEFGRIAAALERIALSLEKLTLERANSSFDTHQNDKDDWITLVDVPPNPYLQASLSLDQSSSIMNQPKGPLVPPPAKSADQQALVVSPFSEYPVNLASSVSSAKAIPAPIMAELELAKPLMTRPKNSILLEYLNERGITVRERKSSQAKIYSDALDKLALYLGQNFTTCQELYKLLKSNIIIPCKPFSYSLVGFTAKQNTIVQKFCQLLKDTELLEEYTYRGRPEYIIQLKASSKEQKYLQGAWLECYAKLEVVRIVQPYAVSIRCYYEALPNLEIIFKDNSKTELDLFFALGQLVFCLEAKMRPDHKNLEIYLNKIKPLGLDYTAIIVIVADKTEEECRELGQILGGVRIVRLTNFEQTLIALLQEQHPRRK